MTGFLIAVGIAVAGWFIGCGFEEAGKEIRKGLSDLADAIRFAED